MAVNAIKADEKSSQTKKSVTLKRLFKYLLSYKMTVFLVTLIMGCSIAISIINPLLLERAINVHVANRDTRRLIIVVSIAGALILVNFFLVKIRMYLMAKMSNDILVKVRNELYSHLQCLSLKFFDSLPAGKILSRVIEDVNSLKGVLSDVVTTLLPQFVTLVAVLAIMIIRNWVLALACLVSLPIVSIGLLVIQRLCYKLWDIKRKKNSNLTAAIHENVAGMRIIQGFAAEERTGNTFQGMLKEDRDAFRDAVWINDRFGPVIDISSAISTIAMYYVAVKFLHLEAVNVGTLVAYGTFSSMIWQPIANLGNLYNQITRNISGANRIFEVLDMEPDVFDKEDAITLPDIKGEVEFKNVSFSYDDTKGVLKDVSFKIQPGETIALVGPTGAGKSTIVNLVSRFYDAVSGEILIDGYNLKDVTLESLRRQMGVMTQDNFLFTGTIKENLRYGRLDATDEEIIEAAKSVHAHDFIMKFKEGYDHKLSERGAGLSAGEKQLLAFARTMVSMPKILILDEATSSIDTQTEKLVQEGIAAVLSGRTSFVIAHRLSTIRNANRIFVVDDGHIVEAGSHDELMKLGGQYYNLYNAQVI